MTPVLPELFLTKPIAHRGYHERGQGRPENSRAAFRAAIEAGYGIELDVQQSADGAAMVFHDYDLGRLTGQSGPVRGRSAAELTHIQLSDAGGETIPSLTEILDLVAGRVPLLIELKDQDGGMGPDIGPMEAAVARALEGYAGPVALMSFNPHSAARMAELMPDTARGLVTDGYDPADWPLSAETCDRLREIPDFERIGASFLSHSVHDLTRPRVQALRAVGTPILCWTVRSAEQDRAVRAHADNVTFEGYAAPVPT